MAEHLDLAVHQAEKHLSDLVVKGAVWARIGKLGSYGLNVFFHFNPFQTV